MMESSVQSISRQEIKELISRLLVEEFDIDPELITDSATMDELDLDSLDLVEIGQIAEQKYGVRIRGSDADDVTDIGGVIEMIHKRIEVAAGDPPDSDKQDG
jgi:acyl carrier protein